MKGVRGSFTIGSAELNEDSSHPFEGNVHCTLTLIPDRVIAMIDAHTGGTYLQAEALQPRQQVRLK